MTIAEKNKLKILNYLQKQKIFYQVYGAKKIPPDIEKILTDELENDEPRDLNKLLQLLKTSVSSHHA
jgi:hypothetical protein